MFSLPEAFARVGASVTAAATLAACSGNASNAPTPAVAISSQARTSASSQVAASNAIEHVLLLSIDGLHAVDLKNFVAAHPTSALAKLASYGTTYTNAQAPYPSDSFPGLLALVTGGHPKSTGVYYDDSFDHELYAPGSSCRGKVGTEVVYDESIDVDSARLDGGGGIDPAKLPLARTLANSCEPVYPHSFLRVNTIFEAIKATGKRTAWADKHLAYDLVNGPSGTGVDDLYTPEIAANGDYTKSFTNIKSYDDIKVAAIINQIDGKSSTGVAGKGVPAIFGMNFQAVSVGQKLNGGGYSDAAGTPSAKLADELTHTDASIGSMIAELAAKNLAGSTLVIITAKHGQSPIDVNLRHAVDDAPYGTALAKNIGNGRYQTDDVALIWLENQNRNNVESAISDLKPFATTLGFANGTVYGGATVLPAGFGNPSDGRTPDIAIEPDHGVIYTGGTKLAEHGGFADDDTHVALLVSLPGRTAKTVMQPVQTTQVAPTILNALGVDPNGLKAVQLEGTPVLP